MSSQDLKIGDVCVFVLPASAALLGRECEIVGEEKHYEKKHVELGACEIWFHTFGFMVRTSDGVRYAVERRCLRKKPPPARFVEDLKRQLNRVPEHA